MGITRPIAEHARRLPAEPALLFEDQRISRRELDETVARLAAFFAARTPRDGAIALDLPNTPVLAVLFLAIAAAGRNAQVLDHEWPVEPARRLLADLKPALAITTREPLGGRSAVLEPNLDLDGVGEALGAPAQFRRVSDPDPEMIFYTGFTSGSSGTPKAFSRTHRSWLASFAGAQEEFEIGAADCVFAPGPLSHSMPLYALASAVHAGARVVMARAFHAGSALRTVAAQRVSVLYAVPTQLLLMIEAAEATKTVCHGVRLVLCSGSKWPPKLTPRLRKVFPEALFAEFYGTSELSFVTVARSDERVPKGSVGRAFPGVEVTVRDVRGRRCAPGRAGMVFAESPLLFSGYVNGEDDILRAGDAMSAGDRGYLTKSGFLHLEGRADRMIISSGRNIHPEEIESVLEMHPAIAHAAVSGIPDERRGVRLIAIVDPHDGAELDAPALMAHLRAALPAYKVPARLATVKKWPSTRSGKTDFAKLSKMWDEGKCQILE